MCDTHRYTRINELTLIDVINNYSQLFIMRLNSSKFI